MPTATTVKSESRTLKIYMHVFYVRSGKVLKFLAYETSIENEMKRTLVYYTVIC